MAQNLYETMFVLKPTLTPEETQARINFVKEVITSQGGEIVAVDEWGSRKLAYKVEKFDRGYYYIAYFKAEICLAHILEVILYVFNTRFFIAVN